MCPVSTRPEQPEPFLRGVTWQASGDVAYPRADPTDPRLPVDTWEAATIPVGVRLELVGDADVIEIAYRTETEDLGQRGSGAGCTFALLRGESTIAEEPAVLGEGVVRLPFGYASPEQPATIHLPEGMRPTIVSVTAVGGIIEPGPTQLRWLAYGDSVTEGWVASGPAHSWAAITGRQVGVNVVNMGYAGGGRGEIASAVQLAELQADVITVAFGTSCWNRTPCSAAMLAEITRSFLEVVRVGHPDCPVLVVSPLLRPGAENTSNRLGATLGDLRAAQEAVVTELARADKSLVLIRGTALIGTELLAADGIHPNDQGHRRIAEVMTERLFASFL